MANEVETLKDQLGRAIEYINGIVRGQDPAYVIGAKRFVSYMRELHPDLPTFEPRDDVQKLTVKKLQYIGTGRWLAKLGDGRMARVQYRGGRLDVKASEVPTDDIKKVVEGPTIFSLRFGDNYLDFINEDEMRILTEEIFAFDLDNAI